jgi:uncharacterized protein (UPF0262 family)
MSQEIKAITLDEGTVRYHNPEIQHEREAAVRDLLQENQFALHQGPAGPYHLHLGVDETQLSIHVQDSAGTPLRTALTVSMQPFHSLIKDYFIIWESYSQALRTAAPEKLQAIDMGRRAVHDEGATLLQKRLKAEVDADFDTLRRLFTLICVLHIK